MWLQTGLPVTWFAGFSLALASYCLGSLQGMLLRILWNPNLQPEHGTMIKEKLFTLVWPVGTVWWAAAQPGSESQFFLGGFLVGLVQAGFRRTMGTIAATASLGWTLVMLPHGYFFENWFYRLVGSDFRGSLAGFLLLTFVFAALGKWRRPRTALYFVVPVPILLGAVVFRACWCQDDGDHHDIIVNASLWLGAVLGSFDWLRMRKFLQHVSET